MTADQSPTQHAPVAALQKRAEELSRGFYEDAKRADKAFCNGSDLTSLPLFNRLGELSKLLSSVIQLLPTTAGGGETTPIKSLEQFDRRYLPKLAARNDFLAGTGESEKASGETGTPAISHAAPASVPSPAPRLTLSDSPTLQAIYDTAQAIEVCGASDLLTAAVTMCGKAMDIARTELSTLRAASALPISSTHGGAPNE